MRRLNTRAPRIAGLLALALGAVALLAVSGVAAAKDRGGDDHGHHGHHHHHHHRVISQSGTITSFDATTGKLTIALTSGESVTGTVTEDTRIECEGFDDRGVDRRDHGGDDNGGPPPTEGTPPPGQACTVSSLVPDAVVAEAELRLEGGSAIFTEIELGETETDS